MQEKYLKHTQESGKEFMTRNIQGPVVMLNMLRFREIADYADSPELSPGEPISGEQAYQLYIIHTIPFLEASGGEILFMGKGGNFLVGPQGEIWDAVMLIRQSSVESFIAFQSDKAYMAGIGHRTAALEDSRLLPLIEDDLLPHDNIY
jgi:hypothetical protein